MPVLRGDNVTRRESKPSTREVSEAGQRKIAAAELDRLIEGATVDCHDESEQISGFYTMLEENIELPFETQVFGVQVTVESLDLTDAEEIVSVCRRGQDRQVVPILHLRFQHHQSKVRSGSRPTVAGRADASERAH